MCVTSYRVNSYKVFEIPPKPPFECVVGRTEPVPKKRRAKIYHDFITQLEPENKHAVETIKRTLD